MNLPKLSIEPESNLFTKKKKSNEDCTVVQMKKLMLQNDSILRWEVSVLSKRKPVSPTILPKSLINMRRNTESELDVKDIKKPKYFDDTLSSMRRKSSPSTNAKAVKK